MPNRDAIAGACFGWKSPGCWQSAVFVEQWPCETRPEHSSSPGDRRSRPAGHHRLDPFARRVSGLPDTEPFVLRSLTVEVYRAPITRPLRTSFGTMTDRPSVIVRATASDGTEGYGEAWCNFPLPGAEHRARLIASFLAPEIVGREWPSPAAVYDHLTIRAHALSLQAGEPGPLPQAIAGIDIALWDVVGRRAGEPLWRLLEAEGGAHVQTYASGIGPAGIVAQALDARAAGHRAFKLKIGFGQDTDLANIEAVRRELGPDAAIAVDADQAWSLSDAARMSSELGPFRLDVARGANPGRQRPPSMASTRRDLTSPAGRRREPPWQRCVRCSDREWCNQSDPTRRRQVGWHLGLPATGPDRSSLRADGIAPTT